LDFLAIVGRSVVFSNFWQFWQVFHYGAMAISAMVQVLAMANGAMANGYGAKSVLLY
jgi:hypothetical protein